MTYLDTHLWPDTARLVDGRLQVGGCDLTALAAEHGTPLYLLDEATLRGAMASYRHAFAVSYPGECRIHYAGKALLNTALARIVAEEGLGLDVVSATELLIARRAGLSLERVHLHGNAKSRAELERALAWQVGAIVVDGFDELAQLTALAADRERVQGVLLRLAPNIDAHTHAHIATGGVSSKFGFPLEAVAEAAARVLAAPGLRLLGLHAHIGSQLFDAPALKATVDVLVEQAALLRDRHGFIAEELSPGGGLGVPYTPDMPPTDIAAYASCLSRAMRAATTTHRLPLPRLTVEPGRSIVARAGVALYTVIGRKQLTSSAVSSLPEGADSHGAPRPYLHIDGGMADNLRPALYGAHYTALLANRAGETPGLQYHVAGRYCESGDILIRDLPLPEARPGDLLAVAVAGAYTLSMAGNYNLVPRPPLLLVGEGHARLIVRRETEADLLAREM